MQVVNRDELLSSLDDIATAFDMRVRPYSATAGMQLGLEHANKSCMMHLSLCATMPCTGMQLTHTNVQHLTLLQYAHVLSLKTGQSTQLAYHSKYLHLLPAVV